jgi:hypothetical protein
LVKIKGYRFQCEKCQVITSIQVFFRANGEVGYARARHLGENKRFYYHQQSIDYVKCKLGELSDIEHGQALKGKFIEQTGLESGLKVKLMVGPPGFEPESIEPKSTSLDQASRRPQNVGCNTISCASIKTLSKPNQKTLDTAQSPKQTGGYVV